MKSNIWERYISILNEHLQPCEEAEVFKKSLVSYAEEFKVEADKLANNGKILIEATDEKEIEVQIHLQKLQIAERMKKMNELMERFHQTLSYYGATLIDEMQNMFHDFAKIKKRIEYEKLQEAHAMKLLDTMEKGALDKQKQYQSFKETLMQIFKEFEELKKVNNNYLN